VRVKLRRGDSKIEMRKLKLASQILTYIILFIQCKVILDALNKHSAHSPKERDTRYKIHMQWAEGLGHVKCVYPKTVGGQ